MKTHTKETAGHMWNHVKSAVDHCTFHQSAQYHMLVRSIACGTLTIWAVGLMLVRSIACGTLTIWAVGLMLVRSIACGTLTIWAVGLMLVRSIACGTLTIWAVGLTAQCGSSTEAQEDQNCCTHTLTHTYTHTHAQSQDHFAFSSLFYNSDFQLKQTFRYLWGTILTPKQMDNKKSSNLVHLEETWWPFLWRRPA